MNKIQITGLRYGAKVVSLVSEVKRLAGVSLTEAKSIVERVIDGEAVVLEFKDEETLREFRVAAENLGAETGPQEGNTMAGGS
jgi:ribosomal protein L7/L12